MGLGIGTGQSGVGTIKRSRRQLGLYVSSKIYSSPQFQEVAF